jgi:RHS repeat-associated protein
MLQHNDTSDPASRLDSISSHFVLDGVGQTSVTGYSYDNTNQLTAADHDAQTDESYTYDANGNRTGAGYQTGFNNQLATDGAYTYRYDAEGNRTARIKLSDGTYTQYIYDHRNRLVSVGERDQPFPTFEPTWETIGPFSVNGEEPHYLQVGVVPAFEGDPLRLMAGLDGVYTEYYIEVVSAIPGVHFTDPNGTSETNWAAVSFSEVFNGHELEIPTHYSSAYTGPLTFLVHLRFDGTELCVVQGVIYDRQADTVESVDYDYDLYNRLVHRSHDADGQLGLNPATDTFFSWENGQIVFQFDSAASAVPSHRYLWNPVAVDQLFADENALNEVLWALNDHLGTPRDLVTYDLVTHAASIANHRVFDSYGILISQTDSDFQVVFGFTGVYFDSVVGLQNNRNRWYDPATGRWLSEDPIGFWAGDSNLLRYVGNDPVNYIDPSGLEEVDWDQVYQQTWDLSWSISWSIGRNAANPAFAVRDMGYQSLQDAYTVWNNSAPNYSLAQRAYMTWAIGPANAAGIRGLSDMCSKNDAVRGHEQSGIERGLDGIDGGGRLAAISGASLLGLRGLSVASPAPTHGSVLSGATKVPQVGRGPSPGSISGNPANRLIETGTPLKNGFGWRKRWYRMNDADERAYGQACQQRLDQLYGETNGLPEAARRAHHFQEMSKFRQWWLEDFLKYRQY